MSCMVGASIEEMLPTKSGETLSSFHGFPFFLCHKTEGQRPFTRRDSNEIAIAEREVAHPWAMTGVPIYTNVYKVRSGTVWMKRKMQENKNKKKRRER